MQDIIRFDPEPTTATYPEPSPLQYPPVGFGPAEQHPIVIDFGSFETRVGWAGNDLPSAEFRSLTGTYLKNESALSAIFTLLPQARLVRRMETWSL